MKVFQQNQIHAAFQHAAEGGQALHLMSGRFAYLRPDTPGCFRVQRQIAHLFDQDRERLAKTGRQLGVRKILVEREGERGQHIDLCGKPLERALAGAHAEAAKELAVFTNPELGDGWGSASEPSGPVEFKAERMAVPVELVPDEVSRRVDVHEKGAIYFAGNRGGKTAAMKILAARPIKIVALDENFPADGAKEGGK